MRLNGEPQADCRFGASAELWPIYAKRYLLRACLSDRRVKAYYVLLPKLVRDLLKGLLKVIVTSGD